MDKRNSTYEEILEEDGVLIYKTVGFSMLPLIHQNRDVIIVKKKPEGRLKKYDVALYKRGDSYILHRIVKVLPDGYIIIGDHQTNKEYDIKDENILGVLDGLIRNGKEVSVRDTKYLIYVHLWCDLLPLRIFILKVIMHSRSIGGKLLRILKGKKHE